MLHLCEKLNCLVIQRAKLISRIIISVFLFRQVTVPCSLHKWSSLKHIRIPSGVTDWVCICCCCPWLHRHDIEMRRICVCYCETNTELNNDKKSMHLAGLYLMWISTLYGIWGFLIAVILAADSGKQSTCPEQNASFKCLQICVITEIHKYLCILNLSSVSSALPWCLRMEFSELTENMGMDTDNILFIIVYKTWKQSHAMDPCSSLLLTRSCIYTWWGSRVQQHVISVGC